MFNYAKIYENAFYIRYRRGAHRIMLKIIINLTSQ